MSPNFSEFDSRTCLVVPYFCLWRHGIFSRCAQHGVLCIWLLFINWCTKPQLTVVQKVSHYTKLSIKLLHHIKVCLWN